MNVLVRRKRMVWVWALTASNLKMLPLRILMWWVPWIGIVMLAFLNFPLVQAIIFAGVTLLAVANFWMLGYVRNARRVPRIIAETISDFTGWHPDLTELELRERMRKQAAQQ